MKDCQINVLFLPGPGGDCDGVPGSTGRRQEHTNKTPQQTEDQLQGFSQEVSRNPQTRSNIMTELVSETIP